MVFARFSVGARELLSVCKEPTFKERAIGGFVLDLLDVSAKKHRQNKKHIKRQQTTRLAKKKMSERLTKRVYSKRGEVFSLGDVP